MQDAGRRRRPHSPGHPVAQPALQSMDRLTSRREYDARSQVVTVTRYSDLAGTQKVGDSPEQGTTHNLTEISNGTPSRE